MGDFRKIGLSDHDIKIFQNAFNDMDLKGDGKINMAEFLVAINMEETPLTKEVFLEIDRSDDNEINFREFVLNTWVYCVKGKTHIAEFAFDMFDTDNSQELDIDEIERLVHMIYGYKGDLVHLKNLCTKFDKNKDGKVTKAEFIKGADNFPAILGPAFSVQTHLRNFIGGESFWFDHMRSSDRLLLSKDVQDIFKDRGAGSVIRKEKKRIKAKKND